MLVANSKSLARIAVVQSLYQYEVLDKKCDIQYLIDNIQKYYRSKNIMTEDYEIPQPTKLKYNDNYFAELLAYTINNLNIIDPIIEGNLSEKWKMNDLPITLLALLRSGTSELKFFPEVPYKVVVDEFTTLATELLAPYEIQFVNSILDKISAQLIIAKNAQ